MGADTQLGLSSPSTRLRDCWYRIATRSKGGGVFEHEHEHEYEHEYDDANG
jgi:hypothetical protein